MDNKGEAAYKQDVSYSRQELYSINDVLARPSLQCLFKVQTLSPGVVWTKLRVHITPILFRA